MEVKTWIRVIRGVIGVFRGVTGVTRTPSILLISSISACSIPYIPNYNHVNVLHLY
jgi:hypothetical protein